jgi:MATE family multidrug resistance protein
VYNKKNNIKYFTVWIWLLAGVLAGCGWQKIGAYVNLGSFYVIGVPCAIVLAFFVHMHAMVNFVV